MNSLQAPSERISQFVEAVAAPKYPNVHNPWRQLCPTETSADGPQRRQARLISHLQTPNPRLLIIGEAPGYQGCRYSGLAFSSERLLVERSIPRMSEIQGLEGERITTRHKPWSEPSATIVWRALHEHGLETNTILFNAFPWHPEGAKGMHSNRTPTTAEKAIGLEYLSMLLAIYPGIQLAALGNTASETLSNLSLKHTKLRHPANGGATKFRLGLAAMVAHGI
ncbi:uracil-DNA glycosylase [Marinobacter salarius]|uniref:Uracil DNA glycosylase superfamily protein n=1 Tax=Marinobacter salarius TaxID=1420917 RepID=A0A1W6KFD3_9GAMM|nr:uracil-DNA glycosylase [Marinobacter salarius]ARM86117.1 uracil DNA glycosylase superfamily protein [Marinobacter salarius]